MARERAVDSRDASAKLTVRRRPRKAYVRKPATIADPVSVAEGAPPTAQHLLDLQRRVGNRAVTAIVNAGRVVQRDVGTIRVTGMDTSLGPLPPAAKPPSDIDLGFNALDIAHRLIESIDQSQLKQLRKGDPGFVEGVMPFARQINFAVVHEQLSGLTASQVKEVEARYMQYEGRPLRVDLLGRGKSGAPPNLSVEQIMRLRALLAGTRAEDGQDPEIAAQHQREADCYELRGILKGSPKGEDVARVLTLLRRTPEEALKLERAYDGNWNLRADLLRMGFPSAMRAMMLLAGSRIAADAHAIMHHRLEIVDIDQQLAKLDPPDPSATDLIVRSLRIGLSSGTVAAYATSIASLKSLRRTHADAIEKIVKLTADEARAEAEAAGAGVLGIDEAVRSRVVTVLGGDVTERTVGGTTGRLINAISRADPSEQAAAELRKLDERGQLTADVLGQVFRNLRQQAEVEAMRLFPDDTAEQLAERTRQLSDSWFIHLRTTFDASAVGGARTFDQVLDRGSQSEVDFKRSLYMASGKLNEVDELVLALRGDRKDLESVKRVLRTKTRDQINELKRQYKIKTTTADNPWGGSLDADLLGFSDAEGKAKGTDRLLIEDYLSRPHDEGGKEEVDYLVARAEREHAYTIENRGATGWWRDHWGNEARSLLDATLAEVRQKRDQYDTLTKQGTDLRATRSQEAKLLIRDLHLARATIRGDRAGYEKATAELRATFLAIASFVLQAVLTAVLSPAAAALFRGISAAAAATRYGIWLKNTVVNMASTIAANKAVYGNQYTRDMLFADLRGGLGGALGSAAVGKLVDPIAGRLQAKLGQQMAGEFIEGAKTYGGLQATAVLEGEGLVAFDTFAQEHFLGKVGERITATTAKGLERVGYGPGPTHAPYDPDAPPRPAAGAAGPDTAPAEAGRADDGRAAADADSDADHELPPTPMALPPELDKTPARGKTPTSRERSATVEEPPAGADRPIEAADSDRDTNETALTPEMERRMARQAEQDRRAREHPLDEASLRSSTAPTERTRTLAAEFAPLYERFQTVTDVVPRNHMIAEIIRRRLSAEGVYEVVVMPGEVPGGARADFDVVHWQINLDSRMLAIRDMTVGQFSDLIESATHEARHALHHWRGLRAALEPDGGFNPDSLVKPNAEAVAAARAANESSAPEHRWRSVEAKGEALEVYQQTFGKGLERGRGKIIADLDQRRRELQAAKAEATKAENELPPGSPRREAATLAATSAYVRWRQAYNRYVKLPQETDAFRRGMAMRASVAEALLLPKIETARQAARAAHAEQVTARRRNDNDGAAAALQRYRVAAEEARRLQTELENLPHRRGVRSTLEQDLAFAREVRTQAQRDAEKARTERDEPARQEAIARFREASEEMRQIRAEMERRSR